MDHFYEFSSKKSNFALQSFQTPPPPSIAPLPAPSTPAPRPLYPRFRPLYPRFHTLYPRTPAPPVHPLRYDTFEKVNNKGAVLPLCCSQTPEDRLSCIETHISYEVHLDYIDFW